MSKASKGLCVYEFDPVIYPRKLWVINGKATEDEMSLFSGYNDETIEPLDDALAYTTTHVIRKETQKKGNLIVVNCFEDAVTGCSVITHEAVHAANSYITEIGIKFDPDNDEPMAYIAGWVARCLDDVINDRAAEHLIAGGDK